LNWNPQRLTKRREFIILFDSARRHQWDQTPPIQDYKLLIKKRFFTWEAQMENMLGYSGTGSDGGPVHRSDSEGTVRIPHKVVLPFGYHIMIRLVTDSEMDRQDVNADGIWDNESKTIYIRKRLPVTRRRYILAHELGHAWLDWQHRYLDDGKART
jgi:hypothetical protein